MPPPVLQSLDIVYRTITSNIISSQGQCVLILGPELSVNRNGVGYKKFFRNVIAEKARESIYFNDDNLFSFYEEYDEWLVTQKVKEFYTDGGDPVLLEMISRIEFPLIINVCPDESLNKIYRDKGIDFREGYFAENSNSEFNSLPKPTKQLPVIYNILGNVNVDQSLILTHSKLYETLEYLLPEGSLPDNLEFYISNIANSFLFLGFKFDSWYYQLICHKLGIKPNKRSKAKVCTPFPEQYENVSVVMKRSFNMDFTTENPYQCVENILKRIEEAGGNLRAPHPSGIYSAFVSYAWKNDDLPEREYVVDLVEQQFGQQHNYTLFRDRKDLQYGDSIDSFMHTIGAGKTVLLVISDKYLRSEYCMTEALRAWEYNDKDRRVFVIVMKDAADAFAADSQLNEQDKRYKKYWYDKCQVLLQDPARLGKAKFFRSVRIYDFIDRFVTDIQDKVNLHIDYKDIVAEDGHYSIPGAEQQAAFGNFINSVINKMS